MIIHVVLPPLLSIFNLFIGHFPSLSFLSLGFRTLVAHPQGMKVTWIKFKFRIYSKPFRLGHICLWTLLIWLMNAKNILKSIFYYSFQPLISNRAVNLCRVSSPKCVLILACSLNCNSSSWKWKTSSNFFANYFSDLWGGKKYLGAVWGN